MVILIVVAAGLVRTVEIEVAAAGVVAVNETMLFL